MSIIFKIKNSNGYEIKTIKEDNYTDLVQRAVAVSKTFSSEAYLSEATVWGRERLEGDTFHRYNLISFKHDKEFVKDVIRKVNNAIEGYIASLKNILSKSLTEEYAVGWYHFKDHSSFAIPEVKLPVLKDVPGEPKITDEAYKIMTTTVWYELERAQRDRIPPEPTIYDDAYNIEIDFVERLFSFFKRKKFETLPDKFQQEHAKWQKLKDECGEFQQQRFKKDHDNWIKLKEEIEKENGKINCQYQEDLKAWEQNKLSFTKQQQENNLSVDKYSKAIEEKQPEAIIFWFTKVLEKIDYNVQYSKQFRLEYDPTVKILVIDFYIPSPDEIPKIKLVKVNQTQEKIIEVPLKDKEREILYDDIIYQIILLTLHKLFKHDNYDVLDGIVLNGWVNSVDKATGKIIKACIVTLQASKNEFTQIDLSKVDPKSCFHALRGIGSSKLLGLSAVAPIISISRDDKRFVPSQDVVGGIDESSNLAMMDWEDFEHLIRELFEKEFKSSGGEVKITRASRDGGVDAVAFDPDPIRGGKIVIQAKRYTNVVGVSAVRDLYGTILNEGATKGILVTTSNYGTDAYEFAKGKPITLLNGNHLLHLLGKHGYKARIDIVEAKKIIKERDDGE